MVKIDFVPNDYIQQHESSRANFMYLVLFAAMMGAIGVTFSIIKMRQSMVENELSAVNSRMLQAHEQIKQLEELKARSKIIIKTALMTEKLLEPVPKSVILACLTNNLPRGVSLLELKLEQKELTPHPPKTASSSQYQATSATAAAGNAANSLIPKEELLETRIEIKGVASSNIEVAGYIARLSESILLDNVELVESKEYKSNNMFQEFKLKMMLRKNILLTKEDIETIRNKREETL